MGQNILTRDQIAPAVAELITETKDTCFLVTPHYQPWGLIEQALAKAAAAEKQIVFILKAPDDGNTEPYLYLNKEFRFDLYFVRNLNTKLYLNEKQVIISSMNLEDVTPERNFEVGYILEGSNFAQDFKETIIDRDILALEPYRTYEGRYLNSLKLKAEESEEEEADQTKQSQAFVGYKTNIGYCIHCRGAIKYYPLNPFCPACLDIWKEHQREDNLENYCHACGKEHPTTLNTPLCPQCYRDKNKKNY